MSEAPIKYIVKGAFEGTFTTQQKQLLTSLSELPSGSEHQIDIYRGIITIATEISEEEYLHSTGKLNFEELTNIEIQKSPYVPLQHDAIFSLKGAKLSDIELIGLQTTDEKTFGTIKGTIYAQAIKNNYKELALPKEEGGDENKFRKNQWNDNNWFDNKGCASFQMNGCLPKINGCRPAGCASPTGCMRWLLYLLLALLLLWLVSQCTQVGAHLRCYYDKWQIERELTKKEEERQKLKDKIEKTKQEIRSCQKIKEPNGTNEPKTYTFDLGHQSGLVTLNYEMYQIPDRVEIIYDGKLVAVTADKQFDKLDLDGKEYNLDYLIPLGYAQGSGQLSYNYVYQKDKPTELLIRVIPSQEFDMTEWTIDILCP